MFILIKRDIILTICDISFFLCSLKVEICKLTFNPSRSEMSPSLKLIPYRNSNSNVHCLVII